MPGDGTAVTKILMVEDHAFFAGALKLVLGQRLSGGLLGSATFHRAATVKEGLRLVAEAGPFALAIVDLILPDGDGTEVVRKVKARWPKTPVCVLSSVEDLSGAIEAGADETLHKSTPLTEIIEVLARLASGGGRTGA
jgi:two-component system nitrate/nitrite response regulator NarL